MPRFFVRFGVPHRAAARRKRLQQQACCKHVMQHEGTPAASHSPCETERFFSKLMFFDKLKQGLL